MVNCSEAQYFALSMGMCEGVWSRQFEIETDPITDALLRVLGPFAVQPVCIESVRYDHRPSGGLVVVRAVSSDQARASVLALRLQQLPCVRSVRICQLDCDDQRDEHARP